MRFMVFMIPGIYQPGKKLDPNFMANPEAMEKMSKYNEELAKAGALIALDGLHPLTAGARVAFSGGKAKVTDGPYVEAKEVVGGYWMLQFKTKEEAVSWAKRCPAQEGDVLEIRQVFEFSEFPEDIQKIADSKLVREKIGR